MKEHVIRGNPFIFLPPNTRFPSFYSLCRFLIPLHNVDERSQGYCAGAHGGRFFGHRPVQNPTKNTHSSLALSRSLAYCSHSGQVIHKNFKISRIRNFYMRKVKFAQDAFDEKLGAILTEFPMLDVCFRSF